MAKKEEEKEEKEGGAWGGAEGSTDMMCYVYLLCQVPDSADVAVNTGTEHTVSDWRPGNFGWFVWVVGCLVLFFSF